MIPTILNPIQTYTKLAWPTNLARQLRKLFFNSMAPFYVYGNLNIKKP